MSDIVERLRSGWRTTLEWEAADEIERLSAAKAELLAALKDAQRHLAVCLPPGRQAENLLSLQDDLIAKHEGDGQ